ncbi:DNA polymerase Y family protein [Jiangella sp. DSM 45060]|uniref:DNA polymerase Y family protein n=1 Tax=Jiangella sp. DSM 45060 TaxID=1798224 RepID=UPI00087C787C|nr:DNA polymerase Y family protein [Jiangella sp. DSM 45060]SDS30501.1 protein ImuB [Jiangella sp. DSM 45060]
MSRRRVLVVWCPDWPVVAAVAEGDVGQGGAGQGGGQSDAGGDAPVVVLAANAVVACNEAARAEGVRRGMRRRDAQSRCPELILVDHNPDRDARVFEPVLVAVEQLRPGVAPLRPGLLAVHAPGRFYGGEESAGALIAERLVRAGVWDCRIGIADDLFTAERAARQAGPQETVVVAAGGSAAFLRGLPVGVIDDDEVAGLLRRLGLQTLGDFARLDPDDVQARFGGYGAKVHRLARGEDASRLGARTPPPDLECQVRFEPPLDTVEAVSFSVRQSADRFVAQLASRGLVCTEVLIEAECDHEIASSRVWAHSRWFSAADLVDRVHWQLRGAQGVTKPVELVRFVPDTIEPAGAHAAALWGGGTDERVERAVARVQGMLGPHAVTVPAVQGGRAPADRQALVPWGERPVGLRPDDLPWPGSLPPPAPVRVYAEPRPATVVDDRGQLVWVSERGVVSAPPTRFRQTTGDAGGGWHPIGAWAGPWPVDELWWEHPAGWVARFQIVGVDGRAWLMTCADDGWYIEAAYD